MTADAREAVDFIYMEAALLDDERYREWLDLFAEDGRYWVPLLGARQAEEEKHNAIADEDRMLLSLRIERLTSGLAHSQHPRSSMQHVLQEPTLLKVREDEGTFTLRTSFVYAESRGDDMVTLYGHYIHRLIRVRNTLRISLKRVNLVNSGSRLPMIQLFP
ncbi:MAG: aromatic-ring-hydroxylating dioxygenase subunit beta [Burkholderiales bacterium]|nr:aromatic-ring-hydroxylating dioxygenase subunit beta [Burkholderiales bacterium]